MKRLIAVLIVFIGILFALRMPVMAADKDYVSISEISEDELKNAAINFSSEFVKKESIETSNIIPIYNLNFELIGYSVTLHVKEVTYGYINFDFSKDDFISDFVIHSGTSDVFSELKNIYCSVIKMQKWRKN